MTDKRIFVVSLSNSEPMTMLAGYRDGQLHIIECKPLSRNLSTLKKTLPDQLTRLKNKGFIVLVDEILPVFARYARGLHLSDLGNDGRPVLVSALRAYHNMINLQALTLPLADSGAFDISDSIVEERRDQNGNVSFNIDWSELRVESTLLLLTITAALQESLLDSSTVSALIDRLNDDPHHRNRRRPFERIMQDYDSRFLSVDCLGAHDE